MQKSHLQKLAVAIMTILLPATFLFPAAAFAATYEGANGQTYTDDDFWFDDTYIEVSPMYEGYARFCFDKPETYYEGYAVYATEGNFTSGLENYEPSYYSENTICYVYPEKFDYDTTVSVHIYPYIELENGARKFLQPGYEATAEVDVDEDDDQWLSAVNLSAESYDGGVYLEWADLSGLGDTFDKYNVLFKKGYYTTLSGSDVSKSYVDWSYYNLVGLNEGDWWTFQVVPVKNENGSYVEVGDRSNVVKVKVNGTDQNQELSTPSITSPYMDQEYTNYPREAYIAWSSVSNATKYEVEVACDVCVSTQTKWLSPYTYTSYTNSITTPALPGDNEYRVRVRAINTSSGEKSEWSSYVYFSYDTSSYADDDNDNYYDNYDISLSITSWADTGLPFVKWTAYDGSFDGYAMFVREGFYDENEVTWEDPAYFETWKTSHQMVKMKEYTTYTVRILPYIQKTTGREFIYPGSNTLHFTTGTDNHNYGDYEGGNQLPPAGYEDDVITAFDDYDNPFPDTSLDTLEGRAAAELYRRGVIGGFPDGEFKGYRNVNRAEIAKFLLLARYGHVSDVANNGQFSDVLEGEWYVKFVVTAASYGIIDGYADGTFKPANNVNVAEFLKMLTRTFDLSTNLTYSYYDVPATAWYAPFAGVAEEYDLFPNGGNYLNPAHEMTRGEVAIAIYQFLLNR